VAELRIAGIEDRDGANRYLARYLARHNRRFTVPAADPVPAWRPLPRWLSIERVCCLEYRRTVARDGTVRAGATILQLPPKENGRSRAGQRVELGSVPPTAARPWTPASDHPWRRATRPTRLQDR
jgi:hypothetical protein